MSISALRSLFKQLGPAPQSSFQPHPWSEPSSWSVVTTVRAPQWMVDQFVRYYVRAGAEEVFLFFDDPATASFKPHHRIRATICDNAYWKDNRPLSIERRQNRNHAKACQLSRAAWLLHVDIDELIHSRQPIGEILASLPPNVFSVLAPTREAIFTKLPSPETLFRTRYFKNPDKANSQIVHDLFGFEISVLV